MRQSVVPTKYFTSNSVNAYTWFVLKVLRVTFTKALSKSTLQKAISTCFFITLAPSEKINKFPVLFFDRNYCKRIKLPIYTVFLNKAHFSMLFSVTLVEVYMNIIGNIMFLMSEGIRFLNTDR